MKMLKHLGILCLSSILILSSCGKKDDNPDNPNPEPPTPNPTPQTEVLKEQQVIVELPKEVDKKVAQELVVSNAYGEFKLIELPTQNKPSPSSRGEEVGRLKMSSRVKFASLGLLLNNVIDKQGNILMCSISDPHSLREIAINAEQTAIALLMLRPELITSDREEYQKVVEILLTLPEFDEYKSQIALELTESIKFHRVPDYQKLKGDNAVLRALLSKTMATPSQSTESQVEITRNSMNKKDGVFNFTITNNLKRVLHIYPKKVYMQDNGLVPRKEEYLSRNVMNIEVPQFSAITPTKANYWKIVYGSLVKGDKSSIFKTTSAPITVDIGDADKLKLEIYGIGKFDKPFAQYTDEQKARIIFVFMHGAYNDFVKPGIDLAFGIENVANASGVDDIAYDFRFGSKKHPEALLLNTAYSAYSNMISNLTLSLLSDTQLMGELAKDFDNKEYLAMTYRMGKFIVSEFYDELQKEIFSESDPSKKAKYLNSLYDIFKKAVGVNKTSDDFRKGLKSFSNQLTHVAKVNFAGKVIKMSELAVDVAGAIYAYFNSDVISTIIEDRADAPYFTLISPQENLQIKEKGAITFKWDFFQGNFRALGDHMKIDLVIECLKRDGTYATETISDLPYNTREKKVDLDKYPAFKGLYIFRWKLIARHRLNSDMNVTSPYANFRTNEIPPLKLSTQEVTVKKDENVEVKITSGTGSYTLTNSNPYIATASLAKANTITIFGKGKGSAVIVVTDNESGEKKNIAVNVQASASEILEGVVIENGVLKKWPKDKIPSDGKVTIPSNVTEIGEKVFNGYDNLVSVVIPNTVTTIGRQAFYNCYYLKSITLSENLTSIGEEAFAYSKALTDIFIPKSVTNIEKAAFSNSNIKNIIIREGVKNIGAGAFASCSNLRIVQIAGSVETFGDNVFSYCENLTNVTIAKGVKSIGNGMFSSCYNLLNVEMPDTITEIGDQAFNACKRLAGIIIPNSVKKIGVLAFQYCGNLNSIKIPNSVTRIGKQAFEYSGIERVEFGNSLQEIETAAFRNCSKLVAVNIPNTVKIIESNTFENCPKLTNVVLSNSLLSISDNVFRGCTNLSSIKIPNSVTRIGVQAFENSGVESVEFGNSLQKIGEAAFRNCSGLVAVTIPNTVKEIESNAFYYCNNLKTVQIAGSVETIGEQAFAYCTALATVTLNNGIKTMGNRIFDNCSSLAKIVVPDSVRNMGIGVFQNCSALESAKLSEKVTRIPSSTFANCYSLKNVEFSNSLTFVDYYAFQNCKSLTTITFPKTISGIYDHNYSYATFGGCTNLKTVNVRATAPFNIIPVLKNTNATVYVPEVSLEAYQNSNSSYKDRIKALK